MSTFLHIPVLYQEVLAALAPTPGGRFIDATLGGGGHAAGVLRAIAPAGKLLGLDADPRAIARVQASSDSGLLHEFAASLTLVQSNFRRLAQVAQATGFTAVDGILLDLGVSSFQLDDPDLGFSFLNEGPLDMRFDPAAAPSAEEVVNTLAEKELADLIYRFGEEPAARRIARAIVHARPLANTGALAQVISRAMGGRRGQRLHPATRTFQALRIFVNDELAALTETLPQAISLLRPGGVLVVLTFHSLEDRIIKQFLRRESQDCICPPRTPICICGHRASLLDLYHKGLTPSPVEIEANPRSRSARLRAARRL